MALFAEDQEMKIRNLAAMLLTLSLTLAASQSALAGKPSDKPPPPLTCNLNDHTHACITELRGVSYAIDWATLNDKDASRLQSKLCAADNKLHVTPTAKTIDAIQKLQDIIDTVNSKKKISQEDAATISGEA
jgi:hypothetical protein